MADRLNTHKITEQNPNSLFAALRNFALDMNFPRRTPSTSIPAAEQDSVEDHRRRSDSLTHLQL